MILRATVNFDPNCEEDTGNVDPFCIDQNAYIDVIFTFYYCNHHHHHHYHYLLIICPINNNQLIDPI